MSQACAAFFVITTACSTRVSSRTPASRHCSGAARAVHGPVRVKNRVEHAGDFTRVLSEGYSRRFSPQVRRRFGQQWFSWVLHKRVAGGVIESLFRTIENPWHEPPPNRCPEPLPRTSGENHVISGSASSSAPASCETSDTRAASASARICRELRHRHSTAFSLLD